MIEGKVSADLDATISLVLLDSKGNRPELDFVVDTGFTGALSMPTSWIKAMDYQWSRATKYILAYGSEIQADVFKARVIWHGEERIVPVDAHEGDLLIGMELLEGSRLMIDVIKSGRVVVQPLAPDNSHSNSGHE